MPPRITIRPAETADAEALALIGAASFLDGFAGVLDGPSIVRHCYAHHNVDAYRKLLETGAQAWIADDKGAPVGYAMISAPDIPGMSDGDMELKRIYLLARYQGSGAASALLQAAIAGAGDAKRLLLGVYEDNARALAFYAKSGFAQVSTRQFNMGGTLCNDRVLALDLTSES